MPPGAVVLGSVPEGSHGFEQCWNILGWADFLDSHGQKFVPGITILANGGRVYRNKSQCLPVKDPSWMWNVIEQFAVTLFALLEYLFGSLTLGHVRDYAHHPNGLALLVAEDLSLGGNPAHRLVFSNDSAFELKVAALKCLLKSLLYKFPILGNHVTEEGFGPPTG